MNKKSLIILLIILIAIVSVLIWWPKEEAPGIEGDLPENGQSEEPGDNLPTAIVKPYFVLVVEGQEEFLPVDREVAVDQDNPQQALEALLDGPSVEEAMIGLTTSINRGTILQSLSIEDGVAYADFNQRLQEEIAGSAMVNAIRQQIELTLLRFEEIDQVVISIDGETEEILQP